MHERNVLIELGQDENYKIEVQFPFSSFSLNFVSFQAIFSCPLYPFLFISFSLEVSAIPFLS